MSVDGTLPTISIVTPALNQVTFVEDALVSVLDQRYPQLEYVVIDGGSTDGTTEVIARYSDRLAFWSSEPDDGQYDAVNKGFAHTSGDVMAWLNSDDRYLPGALAAVAEIFAAFPDVEWISTVRPVVWNERGAAFYCGDAGGFDRPSFLHGAMLPAAGGYARSWIQQESTFWRRSVWERAGGYVTTSCGLAGDFELWARFYRHAELYGVAALLGGFRVHHDQATSGRLAEYASVARTVLRNHGGKPYGRTESALRHGLRSLTAGRSFRHGGGLLTHALAHLPLAEPVKTIVWRGDRWEIVRDFAF